MPPAVGNESRRADPLSDPAPGLAQEVQPMRKVVLWSGVPAGAVVAGVVLWFTLIPGRSGAG
ncbi:MAG: hypothetical protein JWO38_3714 [Gemmataceae bacterium]|nr:hypothetical protein [Gemmataceae bacterium]